MHEKYINIYNIYLIKKIYIKLFSRVINTNQLNVIFFCLKYILNEKKYCIFIKLCSYFKYFLVNKSSTLTKAMIK